MKDATALERQQHRERFIVRFMLERPSAMYDIGVGPKTEWITLGEIFPEMQICGVEANPDMVKSILANGWKGPLLQKAVFSTRGELTLRVYRDDGLDASLLDIPKRPVTSEYTVPAVTLDDVDAEFGKLDNILLWMDIEGAELTALQSGPRLMSSGRVKWINLEVRPDPPWSGGCSAAQVDEFLRSAGYKKVADYNFHEKSSHHDVIYCHEDVEVNPKPGPNHVPKK